MMPLKQFFALALLCAILTLAVPCLALSGTLDRLDAADELTMTISGLSFKQMNGSESGLAVLNAFLAPLSAEVSASSASARLAFRSGQKEISALRLQAAEWPDEHSLPHEALRRLFTEALPALYESCLPAEEAEIPEPEFKNARVRNLPASTQRTTLTVTPAQLAAADDVLGVFRACGSQLCAYLPGAAETTSWLDGLEAASDLTLKRLENADGDAVAWQLTGQVSSNGKDRRKLTLYGGVSGMNVYVSIKLPARSGKNRFELIIDLKDRNGKKESTLEGSITCKRVLDGISYTITDTVKLKNDLTGGEHLTGSIQRSLTEDSIKTVWTVKPDLTGDGNALSGSLTVTKKHAQTQVWQAIADIALKPGISTETETADDPVAFSTQLLSYLSACREALSPDQQRLFDHMLRTDAWMNGPVVPVPDRK